jgi:threonylcarbamoyladenosine tRNA methylthiotransferase MtaB
MGSASRVAPRPRPRVALYTLGCRVNQAESAAMRGQLIPIADIVTLDEDPDVVLLNGCTVTAQAERKTRQVAGRIRRAQPRATLLLIGCLADAVGLGLTRFRGADLVAGNPWKARVEEAVWRATQGERGILAGPPGDAASPARAPSPVPDADRVRAFLKIQDGCRHGCTYCRTTQVRGAPRSRRFAEVIDEAQALTLLGIREIVLVGIDLADYGSPDGDLAALLPRLARLPGLRRLRLGSLNPPGVTAALIESIAGTPAVCRHIHLPLQSGDDRVLERMGRPYDVAAFRAAVDRIRAALPDATFGTDLLVGFPGESEAAFQRTCRLVDEVGFVNAHVFRYSRRRGTRAAAWTDDISPHDKRRRSTHLEELVRARRARVLDSMVGTEQSVLVERTDGRRVMGYTRGYVRAAVCAPRGAAPGSEFAFNVSAATPDHLCGTASDA